MPACQRAAHRLLRKAQTCLVEPATMRVGCQAAAMRVREPTSQGSRHCGQSQQQGEGLHPTLSTAVEKIIGCLSCRVWRCGNRRGRRIAALPGWFAKCQANNNCSPQLCNGALRCSGVRHPVPPAAPAAAAAAAAAWHMLPLPRLLNPQPGKGPEGNGILPNDHMNDEVWGDQSLHMR